MAERPTLDSFVKRPPLESFVGASSAAPMSAGEIASDVAKSGGIGLVKGALDTLGLPGTIGSAASAATDFIGDKLGVSPETVGQFKKNFRTGAQLNPVLSPFTGKSGAEIQGDVQKLTGEFYKPKTTGGKIAETVGEFLPGAAIGPGRLAGRVATAVTAGLGSEAAGQLAEGTEAEPYARIVGGIAGGLGPAAVGRAIAPVRVSPQRAAHVQNLRAEGVEPTAGDISGSRALKFAESSLGDAPFSGGAYSAKREQIGQQYTRAALARIGETATEATPQVIDRAFTRIGGQFDALAARNNAKYDIPFVDQVTKAVDDYNHLFVDPMRKPMVDQVMNGILNKLHRGVMDGSEYKAMRSQVDRMRRGQMKDPEMSMFLAEVRDALDSLMERSIKANNPADLGAWQEARTQYRNALAIERTVTGAGEQSASGQITPAKLRQAAVGQSRRSYARGHGDFADLARSGEVVLKPPPSSGTSERLHQIGGIGAGVGSMLLGHSAEALPAAIAGYVSPGIMGRGIMSEPVQRYLKGELPGQSIGAAMGPAVRGGAWRGLYGALQKEIDERNKRELYRSTE